MAKCLAYCCCNKRLGGSLVVLLAQRGPGALSEKLRGSKRNNRAAKFGPMHLALGTVSIYCLPACLLVPQGHPK